MRQGHVYSTDELRALQNELLCILKEIDQICKRNDIKYFAVGGTLLGAVRHHGFIPWDDDIDIGMLRSDYNKFISIAKKELPNDYFILNFNENNHFPASFTKVCKKNTTFVEYETRKLKYPHCLFVDIMRYDKTFDDSNKRTKHLKKGKMYHQLFKSKMLWGVSSLSSAKKKKLGKVVRPILHILLSPFPKKFIYNKMIKSMSKYNNLIEGEPITFWSEERFANPAKCYFPLVISSFEDIEIPIPNNYDVILKKQYGNYMELPPKEKRVSHSPYLLKL